MFSEGYYLITEKKEIDRVLRLNYKLFASPEYYFGEDTLQNDESLFNTSVFKILTVFLSCGRFRSPSNTYIALNSIIKNFNSNIFIDYCYFPFYKDLSLLQKLKLPLLFGNVSHAYVCDYDLVLVNISVNKEIFNLPIILHNSSIPLSCDLRLKDSAVPLFILGGSSSCVAHGAFGETGYGKSLVDLAVFGKAESVLPEIINKLIDCKLNNSLHKREKLDTVLNLFTDNKLKNKIYFPWGYSVSNNKLVVKPELENILPDKVKYIWDSRDIGFGNKIFNLDGNFASGGDVLISSGCAGQGTCSFCFEGTIGGPWRERAITQIDKDLVNLKTTACPDTVSIYSYNSNYYYDLYALINKCSDYFNRIALLSSRADVYADSGDYLELAESLGTVKISIAAEGLSDRVRNEFLNKNLPRDKFYSAVSNILKRKFLTLKINYILTGRETFFDFEEWVEDLAYFTELRDKYKSKTIITLTVTNLIIYDPTPLRYEKRVMARESYNYLNSKFINTFINYLNKIKALGCGFTVYGSGYSTCVEQLILDLGIKGTECIVRSALECGVVYYRDISKKHCLAYIGLVEKDFDIKQLLDSKQVDYVFPSDIIDFNKYYNIGLDEYRYLKRVCLASGNTDSIKDGVCYSCDYNCDKTIYTNKTRTVSLEQVKNKLIQKKNGITIRFIIDRKNRFEYVSPLVQSRLALASLIRLLVYECGDSALKFKTKEKLSNLYWISGEKLKPYYSGKLFIDYEIFSDLDISLVKDKIIGSSGFKSFTISNIFTPDFEMRKKDWNVFVGYMMFPREEFFRRYDSVFKLSQQPKIKLKEDRKITKLVLVENTISRGDIKIYYEEIKGGMAVAVICRAYISPYLLIKTLFPRLTLEHIFSRSDFSLIGSFRDMVTGVKCFSCGEGEDVYYDLIKNGLSKVCLKCYAKIYLSKYLKRGD